ncbi:MAG: hypothetical protein ACSHW7_00530 [Patiriisocius sp.]|uniref:hypothetical protein n=1 Tax=Patiriisocius sp. TaxID=2822396 RepID=UPI003EF2FD72
MKRLIKIMLIVITALCIKGCDDIFEEDISGLEVDTITPLNGAIVEGNTVDFLWNSLEGAKDYTLQVYDTNTLVEDTVITTNQYTRVLATGEYEWRIKAQNNGYETPFNFPINFSVTETEDLTNQTVVLNSPSDNLYTNDQEILFVWNSVPFAITYQFELSRVSTSGSVIILVENDIVDTSLFLDATTLDGDTEYTWSVKALNETSETQFFSRTLFIDTIAPQPPILVTPTFEEEFILTDLILFSWELGQDSGNVMSPVNSYYEIARDSDFTDILVSESTTITSFTYGFQEIGTYYWRVRAEDEVGNIGGFNASGKLIVNE